MTVLEARLLAEIISSIDDDWGAGREAVVRARLHRLQNHCTEHANIRVRVLELNGPATAAAAHPKQRKSSTAPPPTS
jgi:hypothetical protein